MYGATGRELNYRDPKDQDKEFSLYDMESLLKIKQHIILQMWLPTSSPILYKISPTFGKELIHLEDYSDDWVAF